MTDLEKFNWLANAQLTQQCLDFAFNLASETKDPDLIFKASSLRRAYQQVVRDIEDRQFRLLAFEIVKGICEE